MVKICYAVAEDIDSVYFRFFAKRFGEKGSRIPGAKGSRGRS